MKNKLLLFCFLTTINFVFAQSLPLDFDDALDNTFVGNGGSVFSADVSPTDGTDNVAKIVGGTDQWNSRIDIALDTYIDMTTANKTFTFDFYTTTADVMAGLVQIGNEENGGFAIEMTFTTDGAIGWQTISLDFNGAANGYPNGGDPVVYGQYAQLSVFTNFGDTGTSTYYVDDIAGAANGGPVVSDPEPMVAAPTPTQDEAADNVISVFSDAYTSLSGTNFNPGWGQATVMSTIDIQSNPTIKYAGLNYQGTEFTPQDVSSHEFIHVDFWAATAGVYEFYLISQTTGEKKYDITSVAEQWVSVDIPLSEYSDQNLGLTDIFQFKVAGAGDIFFDNWFFHGSTTPPVVLEPTTAAPAPMNACVTSVFSDAYTDLAGTNFYPAWGQETAASMVMIESNETLKYGGLNYQGTEFTTPQDLSGYEFLHVDLWTANSTDLNFYLISGAWPATTEVSYSLTSSIVNEQWVSIDIPLSSFGAVDLEDVVQFKVDGNGNVWFDNWYFHSGGNVDMPAAGVAATVTATEQCESGTWAYYADASTPDEYAMAIDWGAGTNATAKAAATVTIDVMAAPTDMDDGTNRTWSMARYWNVDLNGESLTDPVSIKFFYDESEKTAIETAMNADGRTATGFKWFKTTDVSFDPSTQITGEGVSGSAIELVNSNTGGLTESGVAYAQFDGITSFSGGSGAAGVGMSALLPVDLNYFAAKAMNASVVLNWETASELNNDYFEVQSSVNGRDFTTFEMVQGAGTSDTNQAYEATDKSPVNGVNYYRLMQVDFDGRFEYSSIQKVDFRANVSDNVVFPNPATEKVNIILAEEATNATLQVYSLTGQLLIEYKISEGAIQQSLDLSTLGKGVYRLNINNNGQNESHSIVLL